MPPIRTNKTRYRHLSLMLLACSALTGAGAAQAQSWTGAVDDDWFKPGNWDINRVPAPSDFGTLIDTSANNPVMIEGPDVRVNLARLYIGLNGCAALTVQGGAKLIVNGQSGIGGGQVTSTTGDATMLISDAGTEVTFGAQIYVAPRENMTGTLTVRNGAILHGLDSAVFGTEPGSVARVTVSGAGSRIDMPGALYMGGVITDPDTYDARLDLLDGGKLIGGASVTNGIGYGARVLISGAGSELRAATALGINGAVRIENGGTLQYETITLGDDALVEVQDGLLLAVAVNHSGGLSIGGNGRVLAAGGEIRIGSLLGMIDNSVLTLDGTRFRSDSIRVLHNAALNVGAADGAAPGHAATFTTGGISLEQGNSRLVFNHDGALTIAAPIHGSGTVLHRAGTTSFTNESYTGFSGLFDLTGGTVLLNGGQTAGELRVSGGATLGGTGSLRSGRALVLDGILAPGGEGVGTLTLAALALSPESILSFQLGQPDQAPGVGNDFIRVSTPDGSGELVLDGVLNIRDVGGFGAGLYRLIDYKGALTDNGLELGSVPENFAATGLTIQTSIAGQVNLAVAAPADRFTFWDGAGPANDDLIGGGTGAWSAANGNWTIVDGSRNGAYDPAGLLVFAGAPGRVTVDGGEGPVTVGAGMQFATDGYLVAGDAISLMGEEALVRVGDGTSDAITATIDAALTGASRLTKTDPGTLILTGANSYTGGTRIAQGTIRGAAGSIAGDVAIENAGVLHFEQTSDGRYAGIVSGAGALRKSGGGTLSVTGNSIGFAGVTTVEAGTLAVTGALGGTTRIASGARLIGNGRLGSLDVAGTVAPGTGAATLRLDGDLIFRTGSVYSVDLTATGGTDLIDAAGRATIEGGTVAVTTLDPETDYADGARYRIVNAAGGLAGRFSGLTEQSAFLDFALEYDPTGASLRISQVRLFPDVALTYNQRQASAGLMELNRGAGTDSLAVYNALLMLDADTARAAFDLSSGEIYASLLAGEQRQALGLAGRYALRGGAAMEEGIGVWGGLTGRRGHVASDGNGARFAQDGAGIEIGVDYRGEANGWAMGAGGGWQSGGLHAAARASHADTDSWYLGGYVRYGNARAGLTATASIVQQWTDARVTRGIAFGGLSRTAGAKPAFSTRAGRIELRYGAQTGPWSLGPAAAMEGSVSRMKGFTETGAQALNLSAGASRDRWVRYGIGAFARFEDGKGHLDMSARLVTGPRNDADVDLFLAGSLRPFNIRAPRVSATGGLMEMSGGYSLGGNWSLSGQARLLATGGETDLSGGARLSYLF